MSTNKMAEVVDSEATPVDTFVPEARLDDNDRHKLIAFYKEKPNNSLATSQNILSFKTVHQKKNLEDFYFPPLI